MPSFAVAFLSVGLLLAVVGAGRRPRLRGPLGWVVVVGVAGCNARDPHSGYPLRFTAERHVRLQSVWVVTVPSRLAGGPEYVEVIYENGARVPADGPSLLYRPRARALPAWAGLPELAGGDFPLLLFGEHDHFVAARRTSDGQPVQPLPSRKRPQPASPAASPIELPVRPHPW